MKHPRFRVRDVLALKPSARDEVYDFIRSAVDANLPAWIRSMVYEIQHVGSYTWGGAGLASDFDFNICLNRDVKWIDYAKARRWYYSAARAGLADACLQFQLQTGQKVDVGMLDVETERYNCYVSLSEMVLHHRTTQFLTEFENSAAGPIFDIEDTAPVALPTTAPAPDPLPPAKNQHLKWDGYGLRWRTVQGAPPWKKTPSWLSDEWAADVPEWEAVYGSRFIRTKIVSDENGTRLEEDVPGS